MTYIVRADDSTLFALKPESTVAAVLQNVRVILSTIQGEVPLDRDLGLEGKFVDKPMNVAQTIVIAEVLEALEQNEPRARFVSAWFQTDAAVPGKLIPIVEVEIIDE